ncbi:MAG: xanthine dehydrogenase family protein subunit M, partial [Chloroflexi bacterium]|nr:xanthine dehydrogenase family protein subunit M [Chloroflexota bacterium]
MLPEFDLLTPQTLSEALEMLAQGTSEVVPLAGGTNLIVDMRSG